MNILKMEDLYNKISLDFVYKLKHQKLPFYLNRLNVSYHNEIHNYATRQNTLLTTHTARTSLCQQCICHSTMVCYNSMPQIIKDKLYTHSNKGFNVYNTNYYISHYSLECVQINCYVCNNT